MTNRRQFVGRKRSFASREYRSGTPGSIIRSANGSNARRAASDYFFSSPSIFYREAILQQCEASYTPRCDSEHTPVRPANNPPLPGYWLLNTGYRPPAHRPQPTAHNLPGYWLPATEYRLPTSCPPPTANCSQSSYLTPCSNSSATMTSSSLPM